MSEEKILSAIEQGLLNRELNECERYVLGKSWQGERYTKIANDSGYETNYIKQVGAKLWSELSSATGKTITKKNLRIVIEPGEIETKQRLPVVPSPDTTTAVNVSSPPISYPSTPVAPGSVL
ncbi:MAG: hypothetical protein AAF630_08655 [Cyanobacteria bacterium P01_C01_bin.38]